MPARMSVRRHDAMLEQSGHLEDISNSDDRIELRASRRQKFRLSIAGYKGSVPAKTEGRSNLSDGVDAVWTLHAHWVLHVCILLNLTFMLHAVCLLHTSACRLSVEDWNIRKCM